MKYKLKQLFLFLGLLSSTCTGQQENGNPLINLETHGICGRAPIPGLHHMKTGYDIRYFALDSIEDSTRHDIFALTCNNDASANTDRNTIITYPDQFDTPTFTSHVTINSTNTFIDHFEGFASEEKNGIVTNTKKDFFKTVGKGMGTAIDAMTTVANISVAPQVGPIFEAVGEIADLMVPPPPKKTISQFSSYLKSTVFLATMDLDMIVYQIRFKKPKHFVVKEDFIEDYNDLPASFLKNPGPFIRFIDDYGTHYIDKATFGGRIRYTFKHDTKSSGKNSRKEVEETYQYWTSQVMNATTQNSSSGSTQAIGRENTKVFGGDVGKAGVPNNQANIKAWEESVYDKPSPMDVSMVPIIALVANETIRIELAQAIMYVVNKESVTRYRQLMNEVINKNSFDNLLEPFIKDRFEQGKRWYAELYDEMDRLLQAVSTDYESMITNCTKEVHEKAKNLTIAYQNVKNLYQLWNEGEITKELKKAVETVHWVYYIAPAGWYVKNKIFKNLGFEDSRVKEIWPLINSVTHDHKQLPQLSLLNKLQDLLLSVKGDNDKYLNSPTMSCDDVTEKEKCYLYTVCTTHLSHSDFGWRRNQNWRDYADEVPSIKYLAKMLTPMNFTSWEINRKDLQEHHWEQCSEWYGDHYHNVFN